MWTVCLFSTAAPADEDASPRPDRELVAQRSDRSDETRKASLYSAIDVGGQWSGRDDAGPALLAMFTVGGRFGEAFSPIRRATTVDPDDAAAREGEDELVVEQHRGGPSSAVLLGPPLAKLAQRTVSKVRELSQTQAEISRLDDLSTRARWSALLPEVRLRVARVVDEDRAFAPTEYDPERITSGNQESFWLEGRATFSLDRLVFASEEVPLERLRLDRVRMDRQHEIEALTWLRRFARATAILCTTDLDPDTAARSAGDQIEALLTLDALTAGWFQNEVTRHSLCEASSASSSARKH